MALIEQIQSRQESMLRLLDEIVSLESPTHAKAEVDRLVAYLVEQCRSRGAEVASHPQADVGDITVATWPGSSSDQEPILVMTHIDTVWPLGTIERRPFTVEDGIARGPGVYDMKNSVVMMLTALDLINEQKLGHRPISWLINTDEEIGSPASRPLIESLARQSSYVLCLEPPVPPHGALKTARKGVGMFNLTITGRAAHAGADPEKGISAIQELANQIDFLHSLTDMALGTTVNVGVVSGGTARNVIAAEASALIDLRVTSMTEAERVVEAILNMRPRLPGTTVKIDGGMNRPPMERTERIIAAFERAREIGAGIGLDLSEGFTGGGSDGNFTAAAGAATIDGLGSVGDGAHAEHEHILVDSFLERTALLTALLTEL